MPIQKPDHLEHNRRTSRLPGALSCLILVLLPFNLLADDEPNEADEKQRIAIVYEQTHTAKTAKDYTQFVDDCRELLAQDFSESNKDYLRSLISWGLNRRGEKRLETADLLLAAKNFGQGDQALVNARTDFLEATRFNPKRSRAWLCLGIANARQLDFESAISDFSTAIKLDSKNQKLYFNRAEAYYEVGQFGKATADYDSVLQQNSADLQALTGRGHCHYAMAEYEKAFSDYDSVAGLNPDNAMALANRAEANQMLGRWQFAYDDFMESIRLDGGNGIALQKTAWMLATCPEKSFKRPLESLQLCQRAIEEIGETPKIIETQAAAETANGDFEKAESLQNQAQSLTVSLDKRIQSRIAIYKRNNVRALSERQAKLGATKSR